MDNKTIHCFIIDDDSDDHDFFQIALEMTGLPYNLSIAQSAARALELLPEFRDMPDYIFLDLNMPLVSGKEFLKTVRQDPAYSNVPVVIYSTSSYHKDIEDTMALGATHFLSKTPDIDKLSKIIASIIGKKELPFIINY